MGEFLNIVEAQREFFLSGQTRNPTFRIARLQWLAEVIREMEPEIFEAIHCDFRKSRFDSYVSEVGLVLAEISNVSRNLKRWIKPQKVCSSLSLWPSTGRIYKQPYGVSLIIAPWNYPFQLLFAPLVSAIAAGNCVVAKPSQLTPVTSRLIAEIAQKVFEPEHVKVVEGDGIIGGQLLEEKFDFIYFCGSEQVGKKVMAAASRHLTPLILELGGKNPCIVDETANLDIAARRIVWGKFFNGGQTCVAPDYLMVHSSIKKQLVKKIGSTIEGFYGKEPKRSPDYCRIINHRHFDRICSLLEGGEIIIGGETMRDELYIAPTVIDGIDRDDAIMQDEIFGPVLPVLSYKDLSDVIWEMSSLPSPLALYIFSNNKKNQERVCNEIPFGGGCINDTVVHYISRMPFGGVGASGFGRLHGKAGIDGFTHEQGILNSSVKIDIKLRYPPHSKSKLRLAKKIIR